MEIKVVRNILEASEKAAVSIRQKLQQEDIFMINLMSSPGAGKTTLIAAFLKEFASYKMAVIEGDIETTKDSEKLSAFNVPIVQINTSVFGGECHLEASWIHSALQELPLDEIDIIFVENVGNLVCPAEFDVGSDLSLVVLSIPEGEDKPVKYPLMFRKADAVVLSKKDLGSAFEYDFEELESNLRLVNGQVPFFYTNSKSGEGVHDVLKFIENGVQKKKNA